MKKHLTNNLKKILIILILIMTIVNVFSMRPFYNNSYADNNSSSSTNAKQDSEVDDVADGITGFVLAPAKFIPLIAGKLLDMILALFSGEVKQQIQYEKVLQFGIIHLEI